MKERKCRTCAWWDYINVNPGQVLGNGWGLQGKCHHECQNVSKDEDDWCRHWSETTGWDAFDLAPIPDEQDTLAESKNFAIADLQEQIKIMKGMLHLAAELFEKDLESLILVQEKWGVSPERNQAIRIKKRWLEEYRTKC